ncbi:hypothetical protein ACSBR1_030076 [Camellia fascicularis]
MHVIPLRHSLSAIALCPRYSTFNAYTTVGPSCINRAPLSVSNPGSPVLGYLIAGIFIGPYGLSIIRHVHGTKAITEFGVVFLMFNIGLELSVERMSSMKKYVFGLGSAQVLVTAMVVGLVSRFIAGLLCPAVFVIGNDLALSSTAVVLQDLAVVVLLILVPLISPNSSKGGLKVLIDSLRIAATTILVVFASVIATASSFVVTMDNFSIIFRLNKILLHITGGNMSMKKLWINLTCKSAKGEEYARSHPPPECDLEKWKNLIDKKWNDINRLKQSKANIDNRNQLKTKHRCGSKSLPVRVHEADNMINIQAEHYSQPGMVPITLEELSVNVLKRRPNWTGPYIIKSIWSGGAVILMDLDGLEFSQPINMDKPNWTGPYIIKSILSGGAIVLMDLDGLEFSQPINMDKLKKYYP